MRRRLGEATAVLALLGAMAAQLAHGLLADGLTNDEVLYIAAGWRQLALGRHDLDTTHPPLAPQVAALGLLGLAPRVPPYEPGGDVVRYAYRFVHVENDPTPLIRRARLPIVVLALALAALAWLWARQACGPGAGLVALALAAFHPSLLAHGHLATTDLLAALAMLCASWCLWRWTRAPSLPWAAAVGAALGAAGATRLTGWLAAPCLLALALAWLRRPSRPRPASGRLALHAATAAALALLVVWGAYGFRARQRPEQAAREGRGAAAAAVGLAERLRALPQDYLAGIRFQLHHNREGHHAYLLGEHARLGWPQYFTVALLVKNTPGFLLALLLAAVVAARGAAPLPAGLAWHGLLPAAFVFAVVSAGRIQIGERYLLPVYAWLVPVAGCALAAWCEARPGGRGARRGAVAALLALHALASLRALPGGHLAYFNVLAGGSAGGHRVLLDSNLDWGQDLPRLARWMRAHGVAEVQLAYMGADDPARFGIAHGDLPGRRLHPPRPAAGPPGGTVAVSPNLLLGLVPPLAATYAPLRQRAPDGRAGVYFIYRLSGP